MTVHLVKGSDPVILDRAAEDVVRSLVGDHDRSQVLEEFRGDDYDLGSVLLAAATVSMFGERVVVARNMSRFTIAELGDLVDLVSDPPEDVGVALIWDKPAGSGERGNPLPKKLRDAVEKGGGVVTDSTPPTGKGRGRWFEEQFSGSPVTLDPAARRLVQETLGEDVGALAGVLELLVVAYPGREDPLGVPDVQAFLSDAGGVPPWDLTDAIDKGDTGLAVNMARRMMGGGARHPLQLMVTLQSHFERMLRLDGAGVHDEKSAAALLGMKGSTYPARKALEQGARLGSQRLARATELLAGADVDLRGATGMPAESVIELLVARLAALSRAGAGHRSRR